MSGHRVSPLAQAVVELESDTFEITDYTDDTEVLLGSTSSSSTSTCSATTSTTSCSA